MPDSTDIPALVERVRELDKAATKGPWFSVNVAGNPVLCTGENYTDCAVLGGLNDGDCDEQQAKRNGELAALYRTAAPVLADEVERLSDEVDTLNRALEMAVNTMQEAVKLVELKSARITELETFLKATGWGPEDE